MERFIALAIRLVRIEPDAPTIMPATIIAVLFNAKPAAAADNPVRALSSEMTTGMSAPPIGNTTIRPRTPAAASSPIIHHSGAPPLPGDAARPLTTAAAIAPMNSRTFTGCCTLPTPSVHPSTIPRSSPNAVSETRHPHQAVDEHRERDDVQHRNEVVHRPCPFVAAAGAADSAEALTATGFLPLNMPSIRSVTTKPPTTLSVPNTTATNRMIWIAS